VTQGPRFSITPTHPRPGRTPDTVSVVIPVRDGADHIGEQLEALTHQTFDGEWEVVLSDNGSIDDTVAIAHTFEDRLNLKVVDSSGGVGASYAHNVGYRAASGEFIACCDADDVVEPGWLEALVSASADHHMIGGRLDEESLNQGVVWRPRVSESALHRTDWLPYAIGANLGIWRSTLESVGGWDVGSLHANDAELSYRVQVQGWTLGFAPDALVKYRHRPDQRSLFRQFYNYGRTDPYVHRRFRSDGHPRSSLGLAARRWARILITAPRAALVKSARAEWIYTLAYSTGRVAGSIKHRTLFL